MKSIFLLTLATTTYALFDTLPDSIFEWLPLIVIPTTVKELQNALCSSYDSNLRCTDNKLKIVFISQMFDYRSLEPNITEEGCYHQSTPQCLIYGQRKLNRNNQCNGLKKTNITYNQACINAQRVGSNKYIISRGGGIIGKGLYLQNVENVLIYGMSITDVCSDLIFGGDAIALDNVTNVWIHRNYISRIGRQLIVTGPGPCQNITISYNEFDGRTSTSAYCDGLHYWLWLFEGSDDHITLYKNYVHHTAGRGPHATGLNDTRVFVYMANNVFRDVGDTGLVQVKDPAGRILMEGNTFINVTYIVNIDAGYIFYPFTIEDTKICTPYLGRDCIMNTVFYSAGLDFVSDKTALEGVSEGLTVNTDIVEKFDRLFQKSIISIGSQITGVSGSKTTTSDKEKTIPKTG